jgi:hypothetical protein
MKAKRVPKKLILSDVINQANLLSLKTKPNEVEVM